MEEINRNMEIYTPCMGALTLKVLTNLWTNQTKDEGCQCVSTQIREVLDKYPSGGDECLQEICELAKANKDHCNKNESKQWKLVYDLVNQRIVNKTFLSG